MFPVTKGDATASMSFVRALALTPPVELRPPDLAPYRESNTGIPYLWSFDSGHPGPHVGINALMHGNELSGAWALVRLFEMGLRPKAGRLSLCFANVAAFERFDPAHPASSRYVDEDMNRIWEAERLDGPASSVELVRARALRSHFHRLDFLLDLHSMYHGSEPLLLCGATARGRRFAKRMAYPATVVADRGHPGGRRLIEYGRFGSPRAKPVAVLLEAGQHWARRSVDVALAGCLHFLRATGVLDRELAMRLVPSRCSRSQRFIEVTHAVTVRHGPFRLEPGFRELEPVERAGTVVATDGGRPVRTPYDRCILILPSRHATVGLTAVRFGRQVAPPRS